MKVNKKTLPGEKIELEKMKEGNLLFLFYTHTQREGGTVFVNFLKKPQRKAVICYLKNMDTKQKISVTPSSFTYLDLSK